ncbi:alpha/beta fold hydrolase [Rhodophyticola sp.]|jgi:haloacetate dehalogenase|uniref:alpha/beta fold hydrolase n=1 Tax=Rhodophyticola sp. TaxID=2680032 RepID=UPI001B1ABF57|nr:alpha/beta hydrolase [Roseicyclus sp.]MBO6624450.1 alpha/beta hydrolase [Roseicyclus sp.]MBO6920661.1 alpha/beta hydrolase [Roseicyclus sp.]
MSDIPGFTRSMIATNGTRLSVHQAGQGARLILLHGYPQNHMSWAKIAPALAEEFHVIIPDLRGYGESDIPPNDAENRAYSKREMALDIVGLMDALDLPRAHILGHDRGARVSYRLALDHPDRVDRLGIIEIVPTGDFWAHWGADLAMKGYHWTFLAQPSPLPERMISSDGPAYTDWTLSSWTHAGDLSPFTAEALASYRRQAADPARVAAMCNDYRAGATFDRVLDEADRAAGRKIAAPLCFVWARGGFPARTGDPLGIWRNWAVTVSGQEITGCGHFAMEEVPDDVLDAILPHFRA